MEKNEAEMKELKLSTAIKLAIAESAQDADLVTGLFDKSTISGGLPLTFFGMTAREHITKPGTSSGELVRSV